MAIEIDKVTAVKSEAILEAAPAIKAEDIASKHALEADESIQPVLAGDLTSNGKLKAGLGELLLVSLVHGGIPETQLWRKVKA